MPNDRGLPEITTNCNKMFAPLKAEAYQPYRLDDLKGCDI
jgi:hypothetical protein